MSTIKSSDEHLTLNADGTSKDIKFQANGVEKASISSAGAFTSTTIDATKLTGTIPNFTSTGIDDNADATAITIDASENVGIGVTPNSGWTATNSKALQMGTQGSLWGNNGGSKGIAVSDNMYWDNANMRYITTDEASQHYQSAGTHYFRVAPSGSADSAISWTTATTITNDGETHILNSSRVDTGDDGLSLGVTGKGFIRFANNGTGSQTNAQFYNSNGNVGTIVTNGSSTSYNTSSDYRLKENVVDMENATDRVKQLKPKRFNFIADDSVTVDGFIAHEVSDIVPEAISGEKDAMMDEEYEVTPAVKDEDGNIVTEAVMGTRSVPDYQGIDQSKLVPLLVKTIQELEARITALEA